MWRGRDRQNERAVAILMESAYLHYEIIGYSIEVITTVVRINYDFRTICAMILLSL